MRDIELMRDETGATANEPADFGLIQLAQELLGFVSEIKAFRGIKLPGKETILWPIKLELVIKIHLVNRVHLTFRIGSNIANQTLLFADVLNANGPAVVASDFIAPDKADAGEWCIVAGVNAAFACSNKKNGDPIRFAGKDKPETQLRFGFTNPSLSRDESGQGINSHT
jgi:hypothetical protein